MRFSLMFISVIKQFIFRRNEDSKFFNQLGIKIVKSHKFLGSVIGPDDSKDIYVEDKVKLWTEAVMKFSEAAKKSPQAVFAAFTKSLQCEWSFLQRVVESSSEKYVSLKDAIQTHLTPAIVGREISNTEHEIFSLPTKFGGLAIKNPVLTVENSFQTSKKAVQKLTQCIKNRAILNVDEHKLHVKTALKEERTIRQARDKEKSAQLISLLPEKKKRTLTRVVEGKASHWLNVIPTAADHYDLSPTQFRDALALRYGHEIPLSQRCDGCDLQMDMNHALNCKKGGLVKYGHDNLCDDGAQLAKLAFQCVNREPVIQEADGIHTPALIADVKIVGLWENGRTAFLDYRIINPDAPSYLSQNWSAISNRHAKEKHQKYDRAAEDVRCGFTPMVCSIDGVLHEEFKTVLTRLASVLADKWSKSYSAVKNFVYVQTEFSIIRAVSMRLRGTRRMIRSIPWEDGAHI
uniref:Uncharacterized protein n=2 Tax=Cacopsylla melanoneura TaxID=428564 RepID=A0A8D8SFY5_9HEMI